MLQVNIDILLQVVKFDRLRVIGGPDLVFFLGGACLAEKILEAAGREFGGMTVGGEAVNVKVVGTID